MLVELAVVLTSAGAVSTAALRARPRAAFIAGAILGLSGLAALILVVFQMIVSVPCIIAGFGILRYHDWARMMLTIVSALNMLNIPIGSTLGAYGLWVLISEETEPLFANPPARFRKKAQAAKAAAAGVKPTESSQKSTSILPSDT